MTPTELSDLRRFVEALYDELAIMFGDLKAAASGAEGVALAPAGTKLESVRLFEVRDELRNFLIERAGQDSFLMRRSF